MKGEVDKVDIYKLVNVPTGFNNLKLKVDNLDVGKLKTIPIYLKKIKFGDLKLTTDADSDRYKYSGYGNGFDVSGSFLLS